MIFGMPIGTWIPWVIAFIGLIVDWYIGLVIWKKKDKDEDDD